MQKVLLFAFIGILLSSILFAGACQDACKADFDKWEKFAQGQLDAKAYYCGLTESNCWSRRGTPSGQPDPCWGMCTDLKCSTWSKCDAEFQSCCRETMRINDQMDLDDCLAACPEEKPNNPWGDNEAAVECEGRVDVTTCSKTPMTTLEPGVLVTTYKDSAAKLTWNSSVGVETEVIICPLVQAYFEKGTTNLAGDEKVASLSSEHSSVRGTINGGGDFICFDPCPPGCRDGGGEGCPKECGGSGSLASSNNDLSLSSEHSSIRGSCNGGGDFIMPEDVEKLVKFADGSSLTVTTLSSEHGSVRGTCNGGGDFISPVTSDGAMLSAKLQTLQWNNRRIGVNIPSGAPEFVLVYALPTGKYGVSVKSEQGAKYVVEASGSGTFNLRVVSGSVVETDPTIGRNTVISQGSTKLIGSNEMPLPPEPGTCVFALLLAMVGVFAFAVKR